MTNTKLNNLKVSVNDAEDLTVLSSILQDATVLIGDMGYDADAQQFLMVAARFILSDEHNSRRLAGINFSGVEKILRRGIKLADKHKTLNLLALRQIQSNIEIIFSGNAMIKLQGQNIKTYAADLGEGWTTQFKPQHKTQ